MRFPRATELAHRWVAERLRPGDLAIDATAGNGHDTLFLAERVGPEGRVFAFDVQPGAIEATRQRLREAGLLDRVELIQAGHETLLARLAETEGTIRAVMFNLGYLPGSDKGTITRPETTLDALGQAASLLAPGGIITLVLYVGHPGGREEAEAVVSHCRSLDPARFHGVRFEAINREKPPPFLIAIERIA